VLICAVVMGANGALVFHYLGLVLPFYLCAGISLVFLAGGCLQVKSEA
jgi:hypothetical protein